MQLSYILLVHTWSLRVARPPHRLHQPALHPPIVCRRTTKNGTNQLVLRLVLTLSINAVDTEYILGGFVARAWRGSAVATGVATEKDHVFDISCVSLGDKTIGFSHQSDSRDRGGLSLVLKHGSHSRRLSRVSRGPCAK